jgi:hypothetical protein
LFVETTDEWSEYLVNDRDDAFLVGILPYAMRHNQDITLEGAVTAELLYNLESYLIKSISDYDENLYCTRIFAESTIEEPVHNEGAVGTGISLGVDCFNTIATMINHKSSSLRITHLLTINHGVRGGFYDKSGWEYNARKLLEREKDVAGKLGLPLIQINTNLGKLVKLGTNIYGSFLMGIIVMSLSKLFKTYYLSSDGSDFSSFNIVNTSNTGNAVYDLLALNCFSINGGLHFYSEGGEKTRLEKIETFIDFPIARQHLQSCLMEHFNCGTCSKCKRNLVSLDAMDALEKFSEVYDIGYYKEHRKEYIKWIVADVFFEKDSTIKSPRYQIHFPIYERIAKKYPDLVKKIELELNPRRLYRKVVEYERKSENQRFYIKFFEKLCTQQNGIQELRSFFSQHSYQNIILYGNTRLSQFFVKMREQLNIAISYIVEDTDEKHSIPRLPEATVKYPTADAIIICDIQSEYLIERRLKERVSIPVVRVEELL